MTVRVLGFEVAGVPGALYRKGSVAPVAVAAANLSYDNPDVRWLVASALIRELRDCTIVSFEEISEATRHTLGVHKGA